MRDPDIEIDKIQVVTDVVQGKDNGSESGQNSNKNITPKSDDNKETEPYPKVKPNQKCRNLLIALPMATFTASLIGFVAALNENKGPDSPAVWGPAVSIIMSYSALVAMRYAKANNSVQPASATRVDKNAIENNIGPGRV